MDLSGLDKSRQMNATVAGDSGEGDVMSFSSKYSQRQTDLGMKNKFYATSECFRKEASTTIQNFGANT
jgi:hypothetical protein